MNDQSHSTQLASIEGAHPLTMSSLEIADLTGKRHDNVVRDIRKMLKTLDGGVPKNGETLDRGVVSNNDTLEGAGLSFEASYSDSTGRKLPCFNLPKRECIILVSGYDVTMRARIVDRWMELEGIVRAAPPAPVNYLDPAHILGFVQALTAQNAEKDQIIADQKKDLVKLERLEGADGSMCITDAAKTLGVFPARDLFARMQAERWIFKRPGNSSWLAYHDKIVAGLMEHDDHLYTDNQGRERVNTRALVTAKGLVKLAEILSRPLH